MMVRMVMIVMMMMLTIVLITNLVAVMMLSCGDGHAMLRSSVRELLCSEAMAAHEVSTPFLRNPCSSGWLSKIVFNLHFLIRF